MLSYYSDWGHRSQFGFIMNSRRDYQLIQSQVIGGVHTIIQLAICKVSGSTKQPPLWALHRSHHLLGQCQIIYCFLHPFPPTESDLSVQIGLVSTQSNISNIYSFLTPSWIFIFSFLFISIISSPRNPIPTTWVCYRTELLNLQWPSSAHSVESRHNAP